MLDDRSSATSWESVATTAVFGPRDSLRDLDASACTSCRWRDKCLPSVLPREAHRDCGASRCTHLSVHRKKALYREGAVFSSIYMVRSGALKAQTTSDDGSEHVIALHLAGDFLGGEGLASGRRTRTVVALEESEVCSISFAALDRLMVEFPSVQRWFHRAMSGELLRCTETMSLLRGGSAEQRIAGFLLDLSRRSTGGGKGGREISLELNRGDIAIYLGLRRETVSRVFSKFQRERLVEGTQEWVELQNPAALQRVASGG